MTPLFTHHRAHRLAQHLAQDPAPTRPSPVFCRLQSAPRAVVAALALALPGAAFPYSLQDLLRLPIERLLQLEISLPAGASGPPAQSAAAKARSPRG